MEKEIKELSLKDKLSILRAVKDKYNGGFLCLDIITVYNELHGNCFSRCSAMKVTDLIPELLEFKPENLKISDSWFGSVAISSNRKKRMMVLNLLIEMIDKKYQDYLKTV
jgi:hypothetical protein